MSFAVSSSSNACSASSGPETTQSSGLFSAAIDRRGSSIARTDSADCATLIMPPAGTRSNNSPRRTTSARPSSNESTPASCAAEYSPMLWPSSVVGVTPHDRQSAAVAVWMM